MSYIKLADFDLLLARSIDTDPSIQAFIDLYEKPYINKILGVELGTLFFASVVPGPAAAPYDAIENVIQEQVESIIYESAGMRKTLVNFIFYHYVKQTQSDNSPSGEVIVSAETAAVLGFENATRAGEVKFNEALEWAATIQWYCFTFKPDDYPTYDGLIIGPQYSPLL